MRNLKSMDPRIDATQRRWISEKMNMGQDQGGSIEKEDPFKKLLDANKDGPRSTPKDQLPPNLVSLLWSGMLVSLLLYPYIALKRNVRGHVPG